MSTLQDLELKSLVKDSPDTSYRRVNVIGSALDVVWDSFTVDYPSTTQEVYSFFSASSLVKTITLNFTDATKENLSSGSKV